MLEGGIIYCGPYNINEPYYIDCGTPGAGMSLLDQVILRTKSSGKEKIFYEIYLDSNT